MATCSGDYSLKLSRARSHLDDLETKLANWANSGHHSVFNEPDPDSGPDCFRLRVSADPVPVDPFAVLIGDVLHNLRGTLDHLAYALAEKHTGRPLPDDIAKDSEFPVFGHKDLKAIRKKIRGIDPTAQTIIESLQPYQRGNHFTSDPLWKLHELSNIDKHRLLLVGALSNAAAAFRPSLSYNYQFTHAIQVYDIPLEPEAVTLRYGAVPVDPRQQMHVDFDPLLKIVFRYGGAVDGKSVVETLRDIYNYIGTRVFGLLGKFL